MSRIHWVWEGSFFVYYESIKQELNKRLIFESRCDARLKDKVEGCTRLAYTVAWGTVVPKDKDEVNKRSVYECDGWVCDLDTPEEEIHRSPLLRPGPETWTWPSGMWSHQHPGQVGSQVSCSRKRRSGPGLRSGGPRDLRPYLWPSRWGPLCRFLSGMGIQTSKWSFEYEYEFEQRR